MQRRKGAFLSALLLLGMLPAGIAFGDSGFPLVWMPELHNS
jgi:hypothetical protein